MRRVKKELGFTLIEILIATAITAIVMIAGTAFIAKFARTSAAFAEGHELEESRGTVTGVLRSDFDGAGRNLTRPSAPGAGIVGGPPVVGISMPPCEFLVSGALAGTPLPRIVTRTAGLFG